MQRCVRCGGHLPDDANFCSVCAAPVARGEHPGGPNSRQERKLVSVVFCDLVGFTGRAEIMDPEDVRALLSSYHRRLRSELERHGGTVEKFIGDAVVAVFGAPLVHEDDAERAVRAAIAIRDWARDQPDVEVRLAVNSGEALVSLDVDPASGEGLVAGDVINTASRLQGAAPVNGVLVGEQTYRATRNSIAYVEHEPVRAHGKANPVAVWEVEAARGRVRGGLVPHERSAFVGRERELAILRDAFARMRDDREPQMVTLIGVPGAGKSRLVYELQRFVDEAPELVAWRHGGCLPYGDGVGLAALADIVKAEAGVLESDSADVAATKLTSAVEVLVSASDANWVERDLRPLIGLAEGDLRPGARMEESFPAWSRFLEALAERGPCVLVVEDLHWADDGLLDFLDEFVGRCVGLPLMLVTTSRPELLTRRPQWGGGKPNVTTLSLPPLSDTDTARIVQTLLARPALSAELQRLLLDRSGGNPLYAEEFARMLAERGEGDLTVPETVQGIIAARLDGLDSEGKRVLQDASVVGPTFWLGAVASLGTTPLAEVEAALRQLEQREFIRRERRSSVEGEVEYVFRHLLVRDAAYNQIPRAQRSERHRRTAEWITSLGRDDHAELIAHHYLEAIEYGRASGGGIAHLSAPARTALRSAGERALGLSSFPQAVRYLSIALELTTKDDDRGELTYHYGLARLFADSTGEDVVAEAIRLLQDAGRFELAARAALLLARYAWGRLDHGAAEAWLAKIDELTADDPHSITRLETLVARSGFYMVAGQYQRAIDAATDALTQLETIERLDLRARAYDVLGTSRCAMGDEGGLDDSRRAIEFAKAGRAVFELHHAINNLITSAIQLGQTQEMRNLMAEARAAFAEFGGTHYSRQWLMVNEADLAANIGEWDRVLIETAAFLGGIPDGQPHYLESTARARRAMLRHARGQDAEARADAQLAYESVRLSSDPQIVVSALCLHGSLMMQLGDREAAEADWAALMQLRDALPEALPQGGVVGFAWLAVDLDHRDQAAEVAERIAAPRWASVARAILTDDAATAADTLEEMDRLTEAAYTGLRAGGEHLVAALRFFEAVGAPRLVADARARLDASA